MGLKMLAVDLGAGSGRTIIGDFDGERIQLEDVHRFSNEPVKVCGSIYWDILRLFYDIKKGIIKCKNNHGKNISSIAIDTWGVDFGLLDAKGNLLGNPYHYRDARTEGMIEEAFKRVPKEEIFLETGIQFMNFNTIYQLLSMKINNDPLLEKTDKLLLLPDLLNYFLTGEKGTEFTIATTTQLYNPISNTWASHLINMIGLPSHIFTDINQPAKIIGKLSNNICDELGTNNIPVVSVASHDTGSAVAAVPCDDEDYVYISSGTWSLVGVESPKPIINREVMELNFTNEGGINNTIRFIKNIMGLWLIQECKRQWEREGNLYSFSELNNMAQSETPFLCYIDPDFHAFVLPGNMPKRIREYCKSTNQQVPKNEGQIIRCILDSLALKYRVAIECLEKIMGRGLNVIHIVGGGIQNRLLCQFTSNATNKRVLAGPVEATSIGNIMVQAMALREIGNIGEARQVIKKSFPIEVYEPQCIEQWEQAYYRFRKIIKIS